MQQFQDICHFVKSLVPCGESALHHNIW